MSCDLIFQITELLFNVTKHILEPKHEILAAEEKQKLLKKYKVEDKQVMSTLYKLVNDGDGSFLE